MKASSRFYLRSNNGKRKALPLSSTKPSRKGKGILARNSIKTQSNELFVQKALVRRKTGRGVKFQKQRIQKEGKKEEKTEKKKEEINKEAVEKKEGKKEEGKKEVHQKAMKKSLLAFYLTETSAIISIVGFLTLEDFFVALIRTNKRLSTHSFAWVPHSSWKLWLNQGMDKTKHVCEEIKKHILPSAITVCGWSDDLQIQETYHSIRSQNDFHLYEKETMCETLCFLPSDLTSPTKFLIRGTSFAYPYDKVIYRISECLTEWEISEFQVKATVRTPRSGSLEESSGCLTFQLNFPKLINSTDLDTFHKMFNELNIALKERFESSKKGLQIVFRVVIFVDFQNVVVHERIPVRQYLLDITSKLDIEVCIRFTNISFQFLTNVEELRQKWNFLKEGKNKKVDFQVDFLQSGDGRCGWEPLNLWLQTWKNVFSPSQFALFGQVNLETSLPLLFQNHPELTLIHNQKFLPCSRSSQFSLLGRNSVTICLGEITEDDVAFVHTWNSRESSNFHVKHWKKVNPVLLRYASFCCLWTMDREGELTVTDCNFDFILVETLY